MKSDAVKVGVVVAVLNQFELALQALESIRTDYDWQPYIIDNWRDNRGVGKAWNLGIKAAFDNRCTHVLVINDDIIIAPKSIDHIIDNWPKDYLLVGLTHYNDITNDPTEKEFDESPDFGGFMVKPETIEQVGYFDENIFAWCEDNDYHRRINLAGGKGGRYHDAPYHHFKSVTTAAISQEQRQAWFDASVAHYTKKWGGYIGSETFDHPYNDPTKTVRDW